MPQKVGQQGNIIEPGQEILGLQMAEGMGVYRIWINMVALCQPL